VIFIRIFGWYSSWAAWSPSPCAATGREWLRWIGIALVGSALLLRFLRR
jgi:hypothetical protein